MQSHCVLERKKIKTNDLAPASRYPDGRATRSDSRGSLSRSRATKYKRPAINNNNRSDSIRKRRRRPPLGLPLSPSVFPPRFWSPEMHLFTGLPHGRSYRLFNNEHKRAAVVGPRAIGPRGLPATEGCDFSPRPSDRRSIGHHGHGTPAIFVLSSCPMDASFSKPHRRVGSSGKIGDRSAGCSAFVFRRVLTANDASGGATALNGVEMKRRRLFFC